MSRYLEAAEKLRKDPSVHYNCAQAVLLAFADLLDADEKTLYAVAANFGSGMKCGSVCGAVTGALMALGMAGIEDPAATGQIFRAEREKHSGCVNCADLLRMNAEAGGVRKVHCDGMVYELTALVEEILKRYGKIGEEA